MENLERKLFNDFSEVSSVILKTMKKNNKYWHDYYKDTKNYKNNLLLNRKLDRLRYYWQMKDIIKSVNFLKKNINKVDKKILYDHFKLKNNFISKFSNLDNFEIIVMFYLEKTLIKFYKSCRFKF